MIQPVIPEEETVDLQNRSSSLSQKQICDNIIGLLAGPKNKSTEIGKIFHRSTLFEILTKSQAWI